MPWNWIVSLIELLGFMPGGRVTVEDRLKMRAKIREMRRKQNISTVLAKGDPKPPSNNEDPKPSRV